MLPSIATSLASLRISPPSFEASIPWRRSLHVHPAALVASQLAFSINILEGLWSRSSISVPVFLPAGLVSDGVLIGVPCGLLALRTEGDQIEGKDGEEAEYVARWMDCGPPGSTCGGRRGATGSCVAALGGVLLARARLFHTISVNECERVRPRKKRVGDRLWEFGMELVPNAAPRRPAFLLRPFSFPLDSLASLFDPLADIVNIRRSFGHFYPPTKVGPWSVSFLIMTTRIVLLVV
nr:hypothetical protein Iba_chr02aCG2900 [Ipomoea batatas]